VPDTKISALTAVATPVGTDEFAVNQGGTSKKVTLSQVMRVAPTAPTVVSVGSSFTSTGVPTATLPSTRAADDILVLCLQSSNEAIVTAPANYTQIGPQNGIGAGAAAGATKLHIFWKRDTGSESAPTIPDTGDHTFGVMFAIRGAIKHGNPFQMIGQNFKFTASTTGTARAGATNIDNMLILSIFAHAWDNASANASGATNASLSSITEQFDGGTADGTGGGLCIVSGIMALSGSLPGTTITWANSTVDVSTTLAVIPDDSVLEDLRPADIQIFIGSPTDLDDYWIKPDGARTVFAQIVDGGGSGSGGNTTGTAAGGGGGGGGGYDEAWYQAADLAASVTVHAGKGGAQVNLAVGGNPGVLSEFDKGNVGPLTSASRIAGTAATVAATADGGNGGCGSGRGRTSPAVNTTRKDLAGLSASNSIRAVGGIGGAGGSGTTAPVGGTPADWGGGGGESGGDTDAAITSANNGWSLRGGGGGSGGRTNTNVSGSGAGGGAAGVISANGAAGTASSRLGYGGSGGVGGGSGTPAGGVGGFPGGGGGGGGGAAGGTGGAGGHGIVVVTTYF
jgi:hypothetical protein